MHARARGRYRSSVHVGLEQPDPRRLPWHSGIPESATPGQLRRAVYVYVVRSRVGRPRRIELPIRSDVQSPAAPGTFRLDHDIGLPTTSERASGIPEFGIRIAQCELGEILGESPSKHRPSRILLQCHQASTHTWRAFNGTRESTGVLLAPCFVGKCSVSVASLKRCARFHTT